MLYIIGSIVRVVGSICGLAVLTVVGFIHCRSSGKVGVVIVLLLLLLLAVPSAADLAVCLLLLILSVGGGVSPPQAPGPKRLTADLTAGLEFCPAVTGQLLACI